VDVTERFSHQARRNRPYAGPLGIWAMSHGSTASRCEERCRSASFFQHTGKFSSNLDQADPEKKKAFVESIVSGKFHNQADKGAESALSCIMAR